MGTLLTFDSLTPGLRIGSISDSGYTIEQLAGARYIIMGDDFEGHTHDSNWLGWFKIANNVPSSIFRLSPEGNHLFDFNGFQVVNSDFSPGWITSSRGSSFQLPGAVSDGITELALAGPGWKDLEWVEIHAAPGGLGLPTRGLDNIHVTTLPEPGTALLLAVGLLMAVATYVRPVNFFKSRKSMADGRI